MQNKLKTIRLSFRSDQLRVESFSRGEFGRISILPAAPQMYLLTLEIKGPLQVRKVSLQFDRDTLIVMDQTRRTLKEAKELRELASKERGPNFISDIKLIRDAMTHVISNFVGGK